MTIREWQREIEHAFQTGDTERYRKLVGQNRRIDRRSTELKLLRERLKQRTWAQWFLEDEVSIF